MIHPPRVCYRHFETWGRPGVNNFEMGSSYGACRLGLNMGPVRSIATPVQLANIERFEKELSSVYYDDNLAYRDEQYLDGFVKALRELDPVAEEIPVRAGTALMRLYRQVDDGKRFRPELVERTQDALEETCLAWVEAGDLQLSGPLEGVLEEGVFRGQAGALVMEFPTQEAERLKSDLAFYEDRSASILGGWERDPNLPEHLDRLMESTQHGLIYSRDLGALERVLKEARQSPTLKAALRPHLPELLGMAGKAEEEGLLGEHTSDRLQLYSEMGQTYPELLEEQEFWGAVRAMIPLKQSSKDALLESVLPLLKARPDQSEVLFSSLAKAPQDELSTAQGRLFEAAVAQADYRPSRAVATHVLTRVIGPKLEVWERYEDDKVLEMSAYLRGLTAARQVQPELLHGFKLNTSGQRLSPEDHLFKQFLSFDKKDFEDYNFKRVSRKDGEYFKAFSDFVGVSERTSELMTTLQASLGQSIQLDEADPKTLLSLALLTQNFDEEPDLEARLTRLLALARSDDFESIRSLKEQLFRRQEIGRRLPELSEVPLSELGTVTALLNQASATSKSEIPLSDYQQTVLQSWSRRLSEFDELAELPGSFGELGTAFETYRFLELNKGSLELGPAWARFAVHLENTEQDLEKSRGVFELEVEVRRRLGNDQFEQHWTEVADYLQKNDWDPKAGWEFFELYAQQARDLPEDVEIGIDDGGIQIGDVYLEIED